ncbi:ATP-binding cassette domain-containing protein [Cupriavidus gilardii]|uniref:ATP-binding cassette domain-containing protein n=1 Tax=Cupriavidus gilardii TaxID=82541 RepID=A0A849BFB7_9BURK|nr:ATP-binding cassette domain-containing protein [Cupriavidus gilardii]ALD91262.1 ABC transporter ATPase [Cupriavidus gilardii CR3]QQE06270.1 ATP-binding cassette domain-containing protein [Cupriavidus sp. ISTL7]KAB0598342.1 ATP-binding cassette domain-containing protein [Cupriavidus gilardii]MCT9012455.1 ATP-binding cassette domain-containing protein [Cupriavidus gilardii]MCT9054421.1 ATP-binding cassette domain-containing protein [Cupriavidus gilardii]
MTLQVQVSKRLDTADRHFALDIGFSSASRRIALFGPSGAGKTLTLRAIAGLLRPERGRIVLGERTLFDAATGIDVPPQQRRVAYLFQDYALFPHLTVAQNVAFGLARGWRNPPRGKSHDDAERWLDAFGLQEIRGHYPAEISGGQKQRVALARALATRPDIVLLDEPFSALDPALRARMRAELRALQTSLEVPMLVISHDPDDVAALADHVMEIRDGRIYGAAGR